MIDGDYQVHVIGKPGDVLPARVDQRPSSGASQDGHEFCDMFEGLGSQQFLFWRPIPRSLKHPSRSQRRGLSAGHNRGDVQRYGLGLGFGALKGSSFFWFPLQSSTPFGGLREIPRR